VVLVVLVVYMAGVVEKVILMETRVVLVVGVLFVLFGVLVEHSPPNVLEINNEFIH
jgi:hypothetical protein